MIPTSSARSCKEYGVIQPSILRETVFVGLSRACQSKHDPPSLKRRDQGPPPVNFIPPSTSYFFFPPVIHRLVSIQEALVERVRDGLSPGAGSVFTRVRV